MAVYEVKGADGKATLVECRTQKAAINHVAAKGFTCKTLTMTEAVKRMRAGETVEAVAEEKAPAVPQPAPIIEHIEAAEAVKANPAAEEVKSEAVTEEKKSFSGRFQKKSA